MNTTLEIPMAFGQPVTSPFNVSSSLLTIILGDEDGDCRPAPYVTESDRTLAYRIISGVSASRLSQADLDRMDWLLFQSDQD